MRSTLEEIYNSQLEITKSEMEQSHKMAMTDLQDALDKEHKEELNRIEQEWTTKLEDLKNDYEREIKDKTVSETVGK